MKIISKIINIFSLRCPECKGKMESEMWDTNADKYVYKCKKCGKMWI